MSVQLDRYRGHGWLTPAQHAAGSRFALDHDHARRYLARRHPDDRPGAERYRLACRALGELRPVAVAVVARGVGCSTWACEAGLRRAEGLTRLQDALGVLVGVYARDAVGAVT